MHLPPYYPYGAYPTPSPAPGAATAVADHAGATAAGIARPHGDNTTAPPPVVEPYPRWAAEDKRPVILGVAGAMIGLAFLFVVARIYCRLISIRRLRLDDFIVIFCIVGVPLNAEPVVPPD
jgi:hypothetical protein